MKNVKIFYGSIVALLAGLLFGIDIILIFWTDRQLEQLWCSSELYYGLGVLVLAIWIALIGVTYDVLFLSKKTGSTTLVELWI